MVFYFVFVYKGDKEMLIYMQTIETEEKRADFEKIYLAYRNLMFYVANRILRNEQDAEDAVHHAFVKIAENMEKIEEPVCPKTKGYVSIIAENRAIDMIRKRSRQSVEEINETTMGISVEYDGENTLTKCILELPGRYREIILLKYVYGYSIAECASVMGIKKDNAAKLDQRAQKRLRQLCEGEGIL